MDHCRLPKEYISATKKDLKLRCFHVQCSELAQHTTACSALAGAAHKSSHAPKKRLQTEAAGHQPCNNSLLQNHFLLLKQSPWPAWSLKRMGQIQQEAQGTIFVGVWFWGVFLLQQRRSETGRGQDWVWRKRGRLRNNRASHPWPGPGFLFPGEEKLQMQEPKMIQKLHFDGSVGPAHGVPCREIGRQKDKSAQGRPG